MRLILSILMAVCVCPMAGTAGTIEGTLIAQGKEVPGDGKGGGKYGSRRYKFLEKVDYQKLEGFVVYIDSEVPFEESAPAGTVRVVAHRNATFLPQVLPLLVGSTVEWPNEDDIYHNAFSISETKPFDLGLYKDDVKSLTFDKPGRVDVFCSIHKSMNCVILVLENPFFASTDERGRFSIPDVPAGTYTLKAWHKRMPAQTRSIVVEETGTTRVDFIMGIQGLPQY